MNFQETPVPPLLYLQATARVQASECPNRADVRDLMQMTAFLRSLKRDWLTARVCLSVEVLG